MYSCIQDKRKIYYIHVYYYCRTFAEKYSCRMTHLRGRYTTMCACECDEQRETTTAASLAHVYACPYCVNGRRQRRSSLRRDVIAVDRFGIPTPPPPQPEPLRSGGTLLLNSCACACVRAFLFFLFILSLAAAGPSALFSPSSAVAVHYIRYSSATPSSYIAVRLTRKSFFFFPIVLRASRRNIVRRYFVSFAF